MPALDDAADRREAKTGPVWVGDVFSAQAEDTSSSGSAWLRA